MKDIKFKDNIIKKNKIPILIYTPEWIQLFKNFQSKAMQKAVEKLEDLLQQEKDCEAELREAEKRKKIVMNKILYLSQEINENGNKGAIAKMEEAERELLDINRKMPELLEELETYPFRINEQNTLVLKETIKKAYNLIKEHKDESEFCQGEVNIIRQKLSTLIQRKVELDERVNKLYSFVHGMIGAAEMESLDEHFLDD